MFGVAGGKQVQRLVVANRRRLAMIRREMDNFNITADAPRITPLARDYPAGHVIGPHAHHTGQLLHAVCGTMRVLMANGCWLIPSSRALWVPPGIAHSIQMAAAVSLRTLYVTPGAHSHLPRACEALQATPVLAALVRDIATDAPTTRLGRHLRGALMLEELSIAATAPCRLPVGRDPRLQRAIRHLLDNQAEAITLDELAADVGASARTLARLFTRETGLTLSQWRERQRLIQALDDLRAGLSVGAVAAKLGYASPSAFGAMIKRATGHAPTALIRNGESGLPTRTRGKAPSEFQ